MHWELMNDIRTEHVTCITRDIWISRQTEK